MPVVSDISLTGQLDPAGAQDGVAAGVNAEPVSELRTRNGGIARACTGVGENGTNKDQRRFRRITALPVWRRHSNVLESRMKRAGAVSSAG